MNILFEKEILKLTEYDLKSIPNLGVKTTNELLSYIKRLQTNQKEEFSPEKVILFLVQILFHKEILKRQ